MRVLSVTCAVTTGKVSHSCILGNPEVFLGKYPGFLDLCPAWVFLPTPPCFLSFLCVLLTNDFTVRVTAKVKLPRGPVAPPATPAGWYCFFSVLSSWECSACAVEGAAVCELQLTRVPGPWHGSQEVSLLGILMISFWMSCDPLSPADALRIWAFV